MSGLLAAEGVKAYYSSSEGLVRAVDGVSVDIDAGDVLGVAGESGCGKSTLSNVLMMNIRPPLRFLGGKVLLDGNQDLGAMDEDGRALLRADTVGFVFQNFQLLNGLTALENVMLPLKLAGAANPRLLACDLLDRVGLRERNSHYPNQLSGGEQQRCAIARAFAAQPELLFADEPTGNLDQQTGKRIIDLLFALNREQGTTLIMATHDESLAEHCDRRLQLDGGRLLNPQEAVSDVGC